jgi:hypothetical protein
MSAALKNLNLALRLKFSDEQLRLFRFLLGALIAYDLIVHFSDLALFFSDDGIFSRASAAASVSSAWWSIYHLSSNLTFTFFVYSCHLGLALLFIAGIGFPWVTPLLWIFQFSLRNRNISIMDGSDDFSVVLLFFSMWLPLTRKLQNDTHRFFARFIQQPMWPLVLMIQIMCLYSFSAMLKSDPSWTRDYTAIALALRLDILVNPFGQWLIQFPTLLKFLTAFVYHLELIGPMIYLLAALIPTRSAIRVQQLVCVLFIGFHLGLSATMRLGVFPYYCIAVWLLLFPTVAQHHLGSEKNKLKPFLASQTPSLIFSLVILATILSVNAKTIQKDTAIAAPLQWLADHLSLHQNWGMFAPYPALDNYHIHTIGVYSDGSTRTLGHEKFWLENRHRVKYWLNMDLKRHDFLTGYTLYWCHRSAAFTLPEPMLVTTKVVFVGRIAKKENAKIETPYIRDVWIQSCTK